MNADRDTTRLVRSWLRADEHENADRVLDIVLSSLDTTPQRRHRWPARRNSLMTNLPKMLAAAAAVVVVAFLGFNLLPQTTGVATQPTAPPTVGPSTSAAPTASPVPLDDQEALSPGRYAIGSLTSANASVAIPAGWSANESWVVRGPKGNDAPDGMAVRFYHVGNVVKNPNAIAEGLLVPHPGPTVDDLVRAIAAQPHWIASDPSPITLDGYAGQRISITIPADAPRDAGDFYLFVDTASGTISGSEPGQTFDLSIVDVDGRRVVIDAFHYPGTSAADRAAQQGVVDSIEFAPTP